ncbi:MAG: hypothetical protein ACLTWR_06350 [Agathobaculum desmolans]
MPLFIFCVVVSSVIDKKEAAALKIKATASKARENLSALRRLFFFCRRPADNKQILCFDLFYQYQLTLR